MYGQRKVYKMSIPSNVSTGIHISQPTHIGSEVEDGTQYSNASRIDRRQDDSGRVEGRIPMGQQETITLIQTAESDFRKYSLYMVIMKLIGERIYARYRYIS